MTIAEEYECYLLSLIFPNSEHFCPLAGFHDSNEDGELYFKKLIFRVALFEFCGNESNAILSRFGLIDDKPLNYFEIQDKYKISREQMRQIESIVLHKVRDPKFLHRFTMPKDYMLARNSSEKLKQILPYDVCTTCYEYFIPTSSECTCDKCKNK